MDERLSRFLRERLRRAGRQYERTRRAYTAGRSEGPSARDEDDPGRHDVDSDPDIDVPTDEAGRARLVCRRYAERRAVGIDDEGRPACFSADHPDCVGCFEDLHAGCIETW
jgi:hypothetical protein